MASKRTAFSFPPAVLCFLVTGQEMAWGSAVHGPQNGKLRAQCDQNWTFLRADSTPGHANAPDMVISTLPALTPFISPLRSGMEMKRRSTT